MSTELFVGIGTVGGLLLAMIGPVLTYLARHLGRIEATQLHIKVTMEKSSKENIEATRHNAAILSAIENRLEHHMRTADNQHTDLINRINRLEETSHTHDKHSL